MKWRVELEGKTAPTRLASPPPFLPSHGYHFVDDRDRKAWQGDERWRFKLRAIVNDSVAFRSSLCAHRSAAPAGQCNRQNNLRYPEDILSFIVDMLLCTLFDVITWIRIHIDVLRGTHFKEKVMKDTSESKDQQLTVSSASLYYSWIWCVNCANDLHRFVSNLGYIMNTSSKTLNIVLLGDLCSLLDHVWIIHVVSFSCCLFSNVQ